MPELVITESVRATDRAHHCSPVTGLTPLLANRVFKFHDNIVDHCCDAWNKLVDQPWRIMSIGVPDWAHRF